MPSFSLFLRFFLLLSGFVGLLAAPLHPLRGEAEKTLPPRFGELEFVEALLNPTVRKVLEGQTVEIVGELTLFDTPHEETKLIRRIGFSKTYGTAIYRIWCELREPLTEEAFDRVSTAPFLALKGICRIQVKTKEVGSDLWYDFSVSLKEGEIIYQAPAENR